MGNTKAQQVVDYCTSKLGCGYIYGTSGQIATAALIDRQKKQYESIDVSVVSKWIGKQVYDCAGFTRMAMLNVGIKIVSGATSQWNATNWAERGTIDTLPKDKVCLLYRATSPTNMQHTGVYCGDGYVIDARGSRNGVIKSKLESYAWTHWGIPVGLYDGQTEENIEVINVLYNAKVIAKSGSTVNFRKEPKAGAYCLAKIPLGEIVEVLEQTDDIWSKIAWDNQTGYMMSAYLEKIDNIEDNGEENWYVKIKCADRTEAETLAKLLGTATLSN